MHIYKGICEYDGTNYSGWQRQTNSNSIQEEIEKALTTILRKDIKITGAGRTDAGVHALNQVFHFEYDATIEIKPTLKSLNSILPDDISIKKIEIINDKFHARYSAKKRTYLYLISQRKNVFYDRFAWTIFSELNYNKLKQIESLFLGKKDFTSFCKAVDEVDSKICDVFYSKWFRKKDYLIYFITADRFVHGMVRGIVGLSVEFARGRLNFNEVLSVIENKLRSPLWAPSKGLILYNVEY